MEVCSDKVECKVSAKRLWQAGVVDAHNCLPKAVPHAIAQVTYEGAGLQAGGFRIIHAQKSYAERMAKENHQEHLVLFTKDKFDLVDHKAFKLKFETVEGGLLGLLVKSTKQTIHIQEGAIPNTCVVHWSFEYEPLSKEHQTVVPPLIIDYMSHGYKKVEEYLLSRNDYKEA